MNLSWKTDRKRQLQEAEEWATYVQPKPMALLSLVQWNQSGYACILWPLNRWQKSSLGRGFFFPAPSREAPMPCNRTSQICAGYFASADLRDTTLGLSGPIQSSGSDLLLPPSLTWFFPTVPPHFPGLKHLFPPPKPSLLYGVHSNLWTVSSQHWAQCWLPAPDWAAIEQNSEEIDLSRLD